MNSFVDVSEQLSILAFKIFDGIFLNVIAFLICFLDNFYILGYHYSLALIIHLFRVQVFANVNHLWHPEKTDLILMILTNRQNKFVCNVPFIREIRLNIFLESFIVNSLAR